jgi:dTDP-4-amino-4,6-dideoxy-D-galactose acyltransferase
MIALATWDSEFFGLRMARLTGGTLTPQQALQVDAWCAEQAVELAVLLADPDDTPTAHTAFRHGWHMIDFRLMLEHDLRAPLDAPRRATRTFQAPDLPALEHIARASFTDSRFLLDPLFPAPQRVPDMYGAWLRRRCGDAAAQASFPPADHIVVADDDAGLPVGFVTCVIRPPDDAGQRVGVVDLVAVDQRARGLYIGESMVRAALRWLAAQGCARAEVVTQGRNVRAQRTYQRCGFLIRRAQTWYHKWYTHRDG